MQVLRKSVKDLVKVVFVEQDVCSRDRLMIERR